MTALFRRRSSTPSWRPDEQASIPKLDLTPDQFWGWVTMFCDDPDEIVNAEDVPPGGTDGTNKHRHHFILDPGRVFDQERIMGQGRIGSVAKMKIRGSDIKFACKTATVRGHVTNLRQEAETLRGISHEHIVRFIGSFTPTETKWHHSLIMSPVGDRDLETFLREIECSSRVESEPYYHLWLRKWFLCLTSALEYLHSKGVRHEDIKPSNIVHRQDQIFFTDFGSSTIFIPEATTSTDTPAHGTPRYAAPEFLDKTQPHGARSDIFSLGCVFVEMLAVINYHPIEELHNFCIERCASIGKAFLYTNALEEVDSWFLNVEPRVATMIIWKEIVKPMLFANREERPTARQVQELLSNSIVRRILPNDCPHCGPHPSVQGSSLGVKRRGSCGDFSGENDVEARSLRLKKLHYVLRSGEACCKSLLPWTLDPNPRGLPDAGIKELSALINLCFIVAVGTIAPCTIAEYVKTLLAYHVHFKQPDKIRFIFAPAMLQVQHLQVLVTRIADDIFVDAWDGGKMSIGAVLWAASHHGRTEYVRVLLQIGNHPNFPVKDGDLGSALHAAAHQGHGPVVDILLTAGANPNTETPIFGTVLIAACYRGHEAVAERLIERGANINAQGGQYNSALWAATHTGHWDLVSLLLSKGAHNDAETKLGGDVITAPRSAGHMDSFEAPLADNTAEEPVRIFTDEQRPWASDLPSSVRSYRPGAGSTYQAPNLPANPNGKSGNLG